MQNEQELIEVDEPEVETSFKKPKKPISEAQLQHLANIREKALQKKKEMKLITEKANKVKEFETMKVAKQIQKQELAKQYDEMVNNSKPKETPKEPEPEPEPEPELIKPKKQEVIAQLPKKKKVIKKIIYQEASSSDSDGADEVEVVKVKKNKKLFAHSESVAPQVKEPPKQENTYTNLLYESSLDKMRTKMMDERAKYLVNSLLPQYN